MVVILGNKDDDHFFQLEIYIKQNYINKEVLY
jgi:hypothetical protein